MKRIISIFIFISILSSCAVGSRISGNYKFDENSSNGLIAVSSRLNEKCDSITLFNSDIYNVKSPGNGTPLIVKNNFLSPDFDNPTGYFFVLELPKGEYAIADVFVMGELEKTELQPEGSFGIAHSAEKLNIRFQVKPNVVSYIGEIEFTTNNNCSKFSTRISNKWSRDTRLFKSRVTNIDPKSVKIDLARIIKI